MFKVFLFSLIFLLVAPVFGQSFFKNRKSSHFKNLKDGNKKVKNACKNNGKSAPKKSNHQSNSTNTKQKTVVKTNTPPPTKSPCGDILKSIVNLDTDASTEQFENFQENKCCSEYQNVIQNYKNNIEQKLKGPAVFNLKLQGDLTVKGIAAPSFSEVSNQTQAFVDKLPSQAVPNAVERLKLMGCIEEDYCKVSKKTPPVINIDPKPETLSVIYDYKGSGLNNGSEKGLDLFKPRPSTSSGILGISTESSESCSSDEESTNSVASLSVQRPFGNSLNAKSKIARMKSSDGSFVYSLKDLEEVIIPGLESGELKRDEVCADVDSVLKGYSSGTLTGGKPGKSFTPGYIIALTTFPSSSEVNDDSVRSKMMFGCNLNKNQKGDHFGSINLNCAIPGAIPQLKDAMESAYKNKENIDDDDTTSKGVLTKLVGDMTDEEFSNFEKNPRDFMCNGQNFVSTTFSKPEHNKFAIELNTNCSPGQVAVFDSQAELLDFKGTLETNTSPTTIRSSTTTQQ